jgi:hypothetical protein
MQSSIADLMMHLHLIVSKARSGMPTQARPMNQKTSMWMMSKNCQSYLQTGHSSRTGLTTIPCSHHDHPRLVLGQTINSVSSFCRSRNSETSNYGMLRTEGLSEQGGRRSKDEAESFVLGEQLSIITPQICMGRCRSVLRKPGRSLSRIRTFFAQTDVE